MTILEICILALLMIAMFVILEMNGGRLRRYLCLPYRDQCRHVPGIGFLFSFIPVHPGVIVVSAAP